MVIDKVRSILTDIFEVEEFTITAETSLEIDLGADFEDMVELSMIIEEEFDILMDDDDFEEIITVGDLVEYIQSKK